MTSLCKTFCSDDLKQKMKILNRRGIGNEVKRGKEDNIGEEEAEKAKKEEKKKEEKKKEEEEKEKEDQEKSEEV